MLIQRQITQERASKGTTCSSLFLRKAWNGSIAWVLRLTLIRVAFSTNQTIWSIWLSQPEGEDRPFVLQKRVISTSEGEETDHPQFSLSRVPAHIFLLVRPGCTLKSGAWNRFEVAIVQELLSFRMTLVPAELRDKPRRCATHPILRKA